MNTTISHSWFNGPWIVLSSLLFVLVPTISAQSNRPQEANVIVGTSVVLEDLIVTVARQDTATEGWFEVAVFDENDQQIASQLVWLRAGERALATLEGFLLNLPESGFQFSSIVRDTAGRDVSRRHAFRTVLECTPSLGECEWRTQDGLWTNALSVHQSLMTALDEVEGRGSSDFLTDILADRPGLGGPVLSLALQMDRLDQQVGLENECTCVWHHTFTLFPNQRDRENGGPGQQPDGSGNEWGQVEGRGARVIAAGQARHSSVYHQVTATGTSQQEMELDCWKIDRWVEVSVESGFPYPGAPPSTIRLPVMEACPDLCRGAVESSAELTYRLSNRVRLPMQGASPFASARVAALFERSDGISHPPQEQTSQAWLGWRPGSSSLGVNREGSIRMPTEGVFLDNDVRHMTLRLSAMATIDLHAHEVDAWSYAVGCLKSSKFRATAHADCAVGPISEAELSVPDAVGGSDDCGEHEIDPWEW